MRVLIIEDDDATATYIRKGLREAGHAADTAADGEQGLARAAGGNYQALVVDRMLPRLDGLALIAKLRARGDNTPALILSALGEVGDRVEGCAPAATTIWQNRSPSPNCWRAWMR